MAAERPDSQLSQAYCILQAACRYNLTMIRQAAVRWLRQNNRAPTGELLFRVKLAELEELCSNHKDWFKNIDRIVELFDFIMPKSGDQSSFKSPWFFFRNVVIVRAAVQGHDDEACMESCNRLLLKVVAEADTSNNDYVKKQEHQEKLVSELASYNGVKDSSALKSSYPGIYQYLKKDPDSQLMIFLKSIRSTLDPDYCFLESTAEQLRDCDTNDSVIELSSESQRRGLKLLLEQFQDCEQSLNNELLHNAEEPIEVPYDSGLDRAESAVDSLHRRKSPTKAGSDKHRPRRESQSHAQDQSESETESVRDKRKRKRSNGQVQPTPRSHQDRHRESSKSARRKSQTSHYEKVEQFKLKRRSIHRAAEEVPDARELANATASKIQKVLAQGRYERWSDNEGEEGYSEDSAEHRMRRESRSPSPRPAYRPPLPEQSHPNHASGIARRPSLGLAPIPSPNNNGRQVRRSVGHWQEYEIEELRLGVTRFGVGQWSQILKHGKFLAGRTSVDLKDKYRNMVKKGLFGA